MEEINDDTFEAVSEHNPGFVVEKEKFSKTKMRKIDHNFPLISQCSKTVGKSCSPAVLECESQGPIFDSFTKGHEAKAEEGLKHFANRSMLD